ncbi:PAS domain-containing protein [Bradyrhizobium sp.]|uniref:PAS domain-containing protein n=1 Tax=Bradyrhizobium sp. TaxID=376 RepID=UPI001D6150E5|nr:PAS domain-containing protein [Bradyrhizobium sp.]MBI5318705.1 PAS domain-containing protein [Bradyrhizobium sp.]
MLILFEGTLGARQTQRFVEEMLHAGHWSWDLDSGSMQWSRGVLDLLGLEGTGVAPTSSAFMDAIHPDDRNAQSDLEQMLRDSIAIEREFRIVNSSGRVRWIAVKAEPIAGPSGNPNRAVGICYDVTKHREELQLMNRHQRRLEGVYRLANLLIWTAKPDGSLREILCWKGGEKLDRSDRPAIGWDSLIHPDDLASFSASWTTAVETRQPLLVQHRLLTPDGAEHDCWSRAVPILDPQGDIQEWIGSSRNIEDIDLLFPRKPGKPTGTQVRAARAILGWSVKELALASRVSQGTIRGMEAIDGPLQRYAAEAAAIQTALFNAGAEFTFSPDGEPGVRPRKPRPRAPTVASLGPGADRICSK